MEEVDCLLEVECMQAVDGMEKGYVQARRINVHARGISGYPDVMQANVMRNSFVNSQEWTLSRGVPDLRLGIVGSLSSGKSALVHRYLTGSYMQEESPEGGRFKKEIVLDGQSYLLLIRDEGGPPELQSITETHAFLMWNKELRYN
ncbi:hypothetical protein Pmani_029826 [Petrolisthes manimaculis]|uniref:Uncharacterized protein n=1 Tax=Petrolisthes manimaculis TaxID=1843537 RepID=A0AAE1NWU4_9EUCA|nr:hypothetical protein Pmani_029826 [Petrolisthes manimaculis]